MKDWQNKACKGEIKLNIISVYINNVGYISGKAYLCTAFCKIINKLMTITLKSKKVDLLIIFCIYNINDYLDKYYNGHF